MFIVQGKVAAEIKKSLELWVGCVAGALSDYGYVTKLAKAGFDDIDIDSTRVYGIENARAFLSGQGPGCRCPGPRGRRQVHQRLYPSEQACCVVVLRAKLLLLKR
jgi:hypothetical protein